MKSETLMELMKQHFATDEGKELCNKIALVYELHIAPKVPFLFYFDLIARALFFNF